MKNEKYTLVELKELEREYLNQKMDEKIFSVFNELETENPRLKFFLEMVGVELVYPTTDEELIRWNEALPKDELEKESEVD